MNKAEEAVFLRANVEKRPYNAVEMCKMYDKKDDTSARYFTKAGDIKKLKLFDMIVFPINICPHCNSSDTYHARMQKNSIENNVWRVDKLEDGNLRRYAKMDICLSCQKEFFIEIYVWKLL